MFNDAVPGKAAQSCLTRNTCMFEAAKITSDQQVTLHLLCDVVWCKPALQEACAGRPQGKARADKVPQPR